ncbi:MerR family transcriptional regulator [Methylopila sp. 73B]|uniref:MerR family transcriptional regulator n=1 Tax=Methylopila sp. 73B TaxID=1120792 RepID=UPI00035CE1C1|nr:MerR family transcriptional regulator [Methylopila sp. 73B]
MEKGPEAFRTISEVAEELGVPQHVLRFWETRFPQIKPIKRGGGRRYYRPNDVDLLTGIKHLLYGEGYTIRGVQRILREQGGRKVAAYADGGAPAPDAADQDVAEARADRAAEAEASIGLLGLQAGPELWAPQRRPPSEPPPAAQAAPPPPVATPDRVDPLREPSPERPTSALPEGHAQRLRTALAELEACRRLLDERL